MPTSSPHGVPDPLAQDYQHRMRNLLSVIRSIIRRTAANSTGVEQFATHLDGRIGAIARVQSALSRVPGGAITMHSLLADELLAHAAHEDRQLTLAGPPVGLRGRVAETLGLAIHELAVNAVTHGALAAAGGHIHAGWAVTPSGDLLLDWKESGVRPVPSAVRGFGREYLERTMAYELRAEVALQVEVDGVRWTIRIPSSPGIVADPA